MLYLEYQSVCSFVRIAFVPSPVCPRPGKRGVQHLLAGEGAEGANSDDWRESLALCILCDSKQSFDFCIN
jgi:hypothetical protein